MARLVESIKGYADMDLEKAKTLSLSSVLADFHYYLPEELLEFALNPEGGDLGHVIEQLGGFSFLNVQTHFKEVLERIASKGPKHTGSTHIVTDLEEEFGRLKATTNNLEGVSVELNLGKPAQSLFQVADTVEYA